MLEGVLSRDDHEREWYFPGSAIRCDLALLHGLEKCRLRLRTGTVDLVANDDVREYRAGLELELMPVAIPDRDAGDIRRQQIRGELDSVELAVDRPGDRLGELGLSHSRNVFDENMTLGDQGEENELDDSSLALDDGLDIGRDAVEILAKTVDSGEVGVCQRASPYEINRTLTTNLVCAALHYL